MEFRDFGTPGVSKFNCGKVIIRKEHMVQAR